MKKILLDRPYRTALLSGVALLYVGMPIAAYADTATNGAPGEIVVTARKRDENIQRVPISIAAFSAKDLADRNISNFNDLANATPGIAITSIAGGNVQSIYLRGLAPANTANDLNVEANVGVFIDGIYQTSRNTLDIISVLDVGQIEIAKGPQSALFGRSTFAGAVAISTSKPSHKLEGSVTGTIGVDKDYRIKGSISAPLAPGLYARVSGGYLTYDGYGANAADASNNLGGTKKYAVSASLEYAPTSNFTALLSGFITHSETEITPETLLPFGSFNCGNKNTTSGVYLLYCGTLQAKKVSDITTNAPPTTTDTRQLSLNMKWKTGGVSIVSATGFTGAENRAYNDYDGTSGGLLFGVCTIGNVPNPNCGSTDFLAAPYTRLVRTNLLSTGVERVRTFSQEFRIQSDNKSPFQWLLGASYFDSEIPLSAGGIGTDAAGLAANERFVQVPVTGVVPSTGSGTYDFTANPFTVANSLTNQLFSSYAAASTQTYGLFGSLGYKLGNLRINAEGRYNIDDKKAQVFSLNNLSSAPFIDQPISGTSVPAAGAFPNAGTPFFKSFKSFAPRFSIDYQATPDIFLYASAAKGIRSGGFNTSSPVSTTGILASEVAYKEETNWTYELGFKSRLFDRHLMLNASVFHVDWSNAQVSSYTLNPTASAGVPRIVTNAGNIKATGFEVQAEATVNKMFAFGGSVTYSDPKFQAGAYDGSQVSQCRVGSGPTSIAAPGCPPIIAVLTANGGTQYVPSLQGLRPQRAVKLQWNLHATVNVPLTDTWRATGRVDVNYTGPAYSNLINTTSFGERTLTSLRLGVENGRFGISAWANNLFNVTYVENSINQPRAGVPFLGLSVPEIYLGEGRRVGLTATAKF